MINSPFQRVYPAQGYTTLDGGLNTKFEPNQILDSESPDCLNVIFDSGKVETRPGSIMLNTASVGSFTCDGLYTRHDNTGAQTMVGWWGGSAYFLSGTSFNTIPSAQSIYTASEQVSAFEYENYIFFGNGGTIPYKFNGAEFTRHGVYPPTSAPTAATAGTGTALTGDYVYGYTNVNSNLVESDISLLTPTITVASQNVALTGLQLPPTSHGINARYLYRTKTSGTVLYRLAVLSNTTATSYDDAIPDSSLVLESPDDNGLPPKFSASVLHQSRVFCIDPDTNFIKYSEIGNPYVFKALSFRRLGDATADIPATLHVYDNSVVVGCKNNSIYMIYTPSSDDADWIDIKIPVNYGSDSPFGAFVYNNRLMIPVNENSVFAGLLALAGGDIDPEATVLSKTGIGGDLKSAKIESEMQAVADGSRHLINSVVFKNRAYIAVPSGTSQQYNNRTFYFDFSQENLARKQKFAFAPWTGVYPAFFCVFKGELYCGDARPIGKVIKLLTENRNDDGAGIDSYLWTKEFFGLPTDEEWMKDFRWINVLYENTTNGSMPITVRVDSDDGNGAALTSLMPNYASSYFDEALWDVGRFGEGARTREQKVSVGAYRGKRIQFKFSNGAVANTTMSILGLKLKYNMRGLR